MKSLMANMIKNRNNKIKADATGNKKLVAEQKKEPVKEGKSVEPAVMKESKTLMLD